MQCTITVLEITYRALLMSMEMELKCFATLNICYLIMYLAGHSHVELPSNRNVRVTDHTHTESMSAHLVKVTVAVT